MIGKMVVVRSNLSGVWLGKLEKKEAAFVTLTEARRAHWWEGSGSCSGLANYGPAPSSRIAAPVLRVEITDAFEVCEARPAAIERWIAVPAWEPGKPE